MQSAKAFWSSITRHEMQQRLPVSVFVLLLAPLALLLFPYTESALSHIGYTPSSPRAAHMLLRDSVPPFRVIFIVSFTLLCTLAAEIYAQRWQTKWRWCLSAAGTAAAALIAVHVAADTSPSSRAFYNLMLLSGVLLIACAQMNPATTDNDASCEEFYRALRRTGTGALAALSVISCAVLLVSLANFAQKTFLDNDLRNLPQIKVGVRLFSGAVITLLLAYVLSKWRTNPAPQAPGQPSPFRRLIYTSLTVSTLASLCLAYFAVCKVLPDIFAQRLPTDETFRHSRAAVGLSIYCTLAGALCFFAFMATYLARKGDIAPARFFHRVVFWALLPLLAMGLYARWPDGNKTFFEEDFVHIGLMGWLFVLGGLILLLREKLGFKYIPLSLAFFILLLAAGPFSARNLTINHQEKLLLSQLRHHGILSDKGITPFKEKPYGHKYPSTYEIKTALDILIRHGEIERILPLITPALDKSAVRLSLPACATAGKCPPPEHGTAINNILIAWGLAEPSQAQHRAIYPSVINEPYNHTVTIQPDRDFQPTGDYAYLGTDIDIPRRGPASRDNPKELIDIHGIGTGAQVSILTPAAHLIEIQVENKNGQRIGSIQIRLPPIEIERQNGMRPTGVAPTALRVIHAENDDIKAMVSVKSLTYKRATSPSIAYQPHKYPVIPVITGMKANVYFTLKKTNTQGLP